MRVCLNVKSKIEKNTGPLSTLELSKASIGLARLSQKSAFRTEIELLKNKGGRLKNLRLVVSKKHPGVIDSNHVFTKILFKYEHIKSLHAPLNLLLSNIRVTYWTIGGRTLARIIVHDCLRCLRFNPKTITPIMGDLSATRVSPSYPFCNTGVNYAGPFMIKDRKDRGYKSNEMLRESFRVFCN